jgi:dihydroorotase
MLVQKLCVAPRQILGLPVPKIEQGQPAEITVFDPDLSWTLEVGHILSKSKNTPFIGQSFTGKVLKTVVGK